MDETLNDLTMLADFVRGQLDSTEEDLLAALDRLRERALAADARVAAAVSAERECIAKICDERHAHATAAAGMDGSSVWQLRQQGRAAEAKNLAMVIRGDTSCVARTTATGAARQDGEQVMPRVNGKPFRCEECNSNVFTRYDGTRFRCNGCGACYHGEGTTAPGAAGERECGYRSLIGRVCVETAGHGGQHRDAAGDAWSAVVVRVHSPEERSAAATRERDRLLAIEAAILAVLDREKVIGKAVEELLARSHTWTCVDVPGDSELTACWKRLRDLLSAPVDAAGGSDG